MFLCVLVFILLLVAFVFCIDSILSEYNCVLPDFIFYCICVFFIIVTVIFVFYASYNDFTVVLFN